MTAYISKQPLPAFSLWEKIKDKRVPLDFYLEITARCNNACHHCYINLPAGDAIAINKELSVDEIGTIADQAIEMGAISCLITGGEPLLRKDFSDIYLSLKRKGLLVSIFTNACMITEEHIRLFTKYPPREIEITVYGITEETYERVTCRKGSYKAFRRGLDLLITSGIKVRLKAMALRSNVNELSAIAEFCRERTVDFFRFDPFLNLRHDGDRTRNEEILKERLSPSEIVEIELADEERVVVLQKICNKLRDVDSSNYRSDHLFRCGAGNMSFVVNYEGTFRLCASLVQPDCTYNLRKGTLAEAWNIHVPHIRDKRTSNQDILDHCQVCPIIKLCMWCPANAYLEIGEMDAFLPYFCELAHARADEIPKRTNS